MSRGCRFPVLEAAAIPPTLNQYCFDCHRWTTSPLMRDGLPGNEHRCRQLCYNKDKQNPLQSLSDFGHSYHFKGHLQNCYCCHLASHACRKNPTVNINALASLSSPFLPTFLLYFRALRASLFSTPTETDLSQVYDRTAV